jgi:hypothetical protein
MDYGMISKREKAKRYAEERGRFHFSAFTVRVDGENDSHEVSFKDDSWQCDCGFFQSRGHCSHTMALEIILDGMLAHS